MRSKEATVRVSRAELEAHCDQPHTPPWTDYIGTFYNPKTKQTFDRVVRRDYSDWFLGKAAR